MSALGRIGKIVGGSRTAGRYLEKGVGRAWSFVSGIFPFLGEDIDPVLRITVALIKTELLAGDGRLEPDEIEAFRSIFAHHYPAHRVQALVNHLEECVPISPEEAAAELQNVPEAVQLSILQMLLALETCTADSAMRREQHALVQRLAELLEIPPEEFRQAELRAGAERAERGRLFKSGAGLLVAVAVIAVFIATATVLKSVVFGLILAYIFWPVERFYERCLRHRRNPVYWLFRAVDLVLSPLPRVARRLAGRKPPEALSEGEQRQRERAQCISRATSLTVMSAVVLALVLLVAGSKFSIRYVERLGVSIRALTNNVTGNEPAAPARQSMLPEGAEPLPDMTNAIAEAAQSALHESQQGGETAGATTTAATAPTGLEVEFTRLSAWIESLKEQFQSLPLVRVALTEISRFVSREDAPQLVIDFIANKTMGLFSFTAGFFSWIGSLLLNTLLTIFFFSLFLSKIASASARSEESQDRSYSGYLVRTVFNGKWLPEAREDTLSDAERIIEQVISKLRIWLRGYLILMTIDFTVYTTVLGLLGVPYFGLFGAIAACGVLLPFIGPMVAATLTVLVTLALGGASVSGWQVLGIVGIFLWQNGIVDQFFLYPLVIGDALGLSTMETIIVVLLGGIFAGITGMLFALPAAAVIKYLVPQIYRVSWRSSGRGERAGVEK